MSTPLPGDVPRLRVRTERRQRPLRIGIGLAVAGVALLVIGGILLNVAQALVVAGGSRATVGDAIEFDAEDSTYTLVLLRTNLVNEEEMDRAVNAIDCTVQFADGSTASVDGSSQFSADSTDLGSSIGTFDAVAGPATVRCTSSQAGQLLADIYAVAEERTVLLYASYGLMAAGLLAGGAAVWLIIIGVRGRPVFET